MSDMSKLADIPTSKLLTLTAFQAICFTVIGLGMHQFSGRAIAGFISAAAWEIALGAALAGGLIFIGAALLRFFPGYGDWLIRSQAGSYPFLRNRLSLRAIVFISICAGLGEETLFRGGVQVLLSNYLPVMAAILLASLMFALIHFAQPAISAIILVIGAIFGAAYWYTGSLMAVIIGHAVYDVYALWALQEGMHRLRVFDDTIEDAAPVV